MNPYLHIVCLDAPAPPDYGGAIDMFYKIKALAETGKKIILHYFDYNKQRSISGLENFCEKIYTYKRKSMVTSLPFSRPHIIQSRINRDLIHRLNEDYHPILLEGLHCSGIAPCLNDSSRAMVRMHNEEASYYHHLAQTEISFLKRTYFRLESRLLYRYQMNMTKGITLACLSESDMHYFEKTYGFQQAHFIPCFIPWQAVTGKAGSGTYCLYHGNMSVSENEEAAQWLVENVFTQISIPLVIAGKGISANLKEATKPFRHISLVQNPSMAEIDQLVQEAHIHVLPSMNTTGVKLKLLNALLNGRHTITNQNGVKGSKITKGVMVIETPAKWRAAILHLMKKAFNEEEIETRKGILSLYNNRHNAQKLSALW